MATPSSTSSSDNVEFKWLPVSRDYELEKESYALPISNAKSFHPLLSKEEIKAVVATTAAKQKNEEKEKENNKVPIDNPLSAKPKTVATPIDDPLRVITKKPIDDPLRAMSAAPTVTASSSLSSSSTVATVSSSVNSSASSTVSENDHNAFSMQGIDITPWRDRRALILSRYTTNKKIPVQANFLEVDDEKKGVVTVDQTKSRLEELESQISSTESAKSFLTQREYISHIEDMHNRLRAAWDNNERVVSLKITIQCAKLLGDTSVPHFYPSMFVLLSQILDTFGESVYQRIKIKANELPPSLTSAKGSAATPGNLPPTFKQKDVSSSAKETCRNWFYKTACIRELIPRLYVDLCLLKSYRFIYDDEQFNGILARLSRGIRGIGDPLAAAYARCYLAQKAMDLHASFSSDSVKPAESRIVPKHYQIILNEAVDDFLFVFRSHLTNEMKDIAAIRDGKIGAEEYTDLFTPAFDFLFNAVGYKSGDDLLFALLSQYKEFCSYSTILAALISSFEPSLISSHAQEFTSLIKETKELPSTPRSKVYLVLGRCLIASPPPVSMRLPLLNDVWKAVTKLKDVNEYMEIAEVFVHYLLANFSEREVNIFMKDVIKHVKKDSAYKTLQKEISSILVKVVSMSNDLHKTLSMDNLLPMVDLLEKKNKIECAKTMLQRFSKHYSRPLSDPVIIHTLFDVAKSLHDSLDSLSFDDEKRQIAALIVYFVTKIDFGRDLEQHLTMMVDARHAFPNLDAVTAELVQKVSLLAMKAHSFMKGNHNKKTGSFVKACLAYCHITIPSLDDIFLRLRLFIQCAQVALINGMIGQGEGFLKAAISTIPDVPATIELFKQIISTEEDLINYCQHFCSVLLLFPGHPEHGPFYLLKALLNATQEYAPWKEIDNQSPQSFGKIKIYLSVLSLLSGYYQRKFIYHIDKVESNDELYGNESTYNKSLSQLIDSIITEILSMLAKLGERSDNNGKQLQANYSIQLIQILISSFVMNANSATLVVKLFQLVNKAGSAADIKYKNNVLNAITKNKSTWFQDIAAKLKATQQ